MTREQPTKITEWRAFGPNGDIRVSICESCIYGRPSWITVQLGRKIEVPDYDSEIRGAMKEIYVAGLEPGQLDVLAEALPEIKEGVRRVVEAAAARVEEERRGLAEDRRKSSKPWPGAEKKRLCDPDKLKRQLLAALDNRPPPAVTKETLKSRAKNAETVARVLAAAAETVARVLAAAAEPTE